MAARQVTELFAARDGEPFSVEAIHEYNGGPAEHWLRIGALGTSFDLSPHDSLMMVAHLFLWYVKTNAGSVVSKLWP